jgi:hypothetical protein
MKHLFASAAICALLAGPAFAQTQPAAPAAEAEEQAEPATPEQVDAAVKTISGLAADETKVAGYCAISKEMAAAPETDEAKMEELGKKMDDYLTKLGDEYAEAFAVAETVAPETEQGKKLDEAYATLETKCGS